MRVGCILCLGLVITSGVFSEDKVGGTNSDAKSNPELYTNAYSVPPTFFQSYPSSNGVDDPFAVPETDSPIRLKSAKQILEEAGITFGPGSAVIYGPGTSSIIIKNTSEQLELVERYFQSIIENQIVNIRFRVDLFQLPAEKLKQLSSRYADTPDQIAASDEVLKLVSEKQATHVSGLLVATHPGQRSKTSSAIEFSWISEIKKEGDSLLPVIESREVGTILEIDPNIGIDNRTIDLTVRLEHHFRRPVFRKSTVDAGDIELAQFNSGMIQSNFAVPDGAARILGTFHDPEKPASGYIAFIKAEIFRLEKFRKVFDEKATF